MHNYATLRGEKELKVGILHTAFIGDVILSGLLIEALAQAGHEVTYFTKKQTAVLLKPDLRIQKIIEIKKDKGFKKIFSIKKIAEQIKTENLDALLVPHRSATSSLCAYLAKVKLTIGFDNANLSFLYKKTAKFNKNEHECTRYLALLNEQLINENTLKTIRNIARPVFKYNPYAFEQFNQKFAKYVFQQPQFKNTVSFEAVKNNFFILAVGSVWKTKKYPISQWVKVAFEILKQHENYYCVLSGSNDDKADIDLFIRLFLEQSKGENHLSSHHHVHSLEEYNQPENRLINAVNLFKLDEFAMFTSFAKFVLSNDSSPVHFASAFNIPVAAIFGPTIPEFGFAPTSQRSKTISYMDEIGQRLHCQPCSIHGKNECPKKHFKCMKDLTPQTVVKQIEINLF